MKKMVLFALLFIKYFAFTQNTQFYDVVSSESDSLFVLGDDGNIYNRVIITETSNTPIFGFTGMTIHPNNGTIYVVVKNQPTRYLATLEMGTSSITKIANLSDKISSIAFSETGVLYGITGDGGNNPNHLYSIDMSSGELTELADFSSLIDDDGEAIAFNSVDGLLYRMAGGSWLYKIDLTNFTSTLVTESLMDDGDSGHAFYFNGNDFISLSGDICTMTSSGAQSNCNNLNYDFKGILPSGFVGIPELISNQEKQLLKILNLLGQEVEYQPNTVLIYQYADGTSEKVFTIGD